MKKYIVAFCCILGVLPLKAAELTIILQEGDLIFQEACSGKSDNTIKAVTTSVDGYNFTHVGIVYKGEKDSLFVIEATIPYVKITPLQDYLFPQKECIPLSVAGRLKEQFRHLIPEAIKQALKHVGKEYDYGYNLNNDAWYCSELIYDIFLYANRGEPLFPLNVMTFKSKDTGEFTEGWIQWFNELDIPIPEGEPGINPGAMSSSDVIYLLGPLSSDK